MLAPLCILAEPGQLMYTPWWRLIQTRAAADWAIRTAAGSVHWLIDTADATKPEGTSLEDFPTFGFRQRLETFTLPSDLLEGA